MQLTEDENTPYNGGFPVDRVITVNVRKHVNFARK